MFTVSKRYYYPYCKYLKVQEGYLYHQKRLDADELSKAKDATAEANLIGVDVVSWWCNAGKTASGMGYIGGLCRDDGRNTNICTAQGELIWTAQKGHVSYRYSTNYTKF